MREEIWKERGTAVLPLLPIRTGATVNEVGMAVEEDGLKERRGEEEEEVAGKEEEEEEEETSHGVGMVVVEEEAQQGGMMPLCQVRLMRRCGCGKGGN